MKDWRDRLRKYIEPMLVYKDNLWWVYTSQQALEDFISELLEEQKEAHKKEMKELVDESINIFKEFKQMAAASLDLFYYRESDIQIKALEQWKKKHN